MKITVVKTCSCLAGVSEFKYSVIFFFYCINLKNLTQLLSMLNFCLFFCKISLPFSCMDVWFNLWSFLCCFPLKSLHPKLESSAVWVVILMKIGALPFDVRNPVLISALCFLVVCSLTQILQIARQFCFDFRLLVLTFSVGLWTGAL